MIEILCNKYIHKYSTVLLMPFANQTQSSGANKSIRFILKLNTFAPYIVFARKTLNTLVNTRDNIALSLLIYAYLHLSLLYLYLPLL